MTEATVPARTTGRLIAWITFVGVLTTLNYLSRFASSGERERDLLYEWSTFVLGLFQFTLMLAIVLWIAAGGPARELLALRRPRSWPAALGIAVLVFIGTLVLAGILGQFVNAEDEQGLLPERWEAARVAPFLANAAVIAVYTPIVEELMFRGLGFTLFSRFGQTVAVLVIGISFGPVHGLVLGLPLLIGFGLGLAYLRHRTDSVLPCILLHGTFNALALLASVTLESES